jgi:hypothetical protein
MPMSFLKKLFTKTNLLVAFKETHVIFYEIRNNNLENQLLVPVHGEKTEELENFIKKHKNTRVKLLLDLNKESYKDIKLPDVGAINARKELDAQLTKDIKNHKIIHPILASKPTAADPFWHFIAVSLTLNKDIIRFIKYLFRGFKKIHSVSLAPVENITLYKNIKNAYFKEDIKQREQQPSCCIIRLYNDTGYLYEVIFQGDSIYSIDFYQIPNKNFAKELAKIDQNTRSKLISSLGIEENTIHIVTLLPEQLKNSIPNQRNNHILSTLDVAKKLDIRSNIKEDSLSFNILSFTNFIRQKPQSLKIQSLNKLNFIYFFQYAFHISLLIITVTVFMLTSKTQSEFLNTQKAHNSLQKRLSTFNDRYQCEIKNKQEMTPILDTEPNLKRLYNIVKMKQYPLDILSTIATSKNNNIFLESFTYRKTKDVLANSVVVINIDYPNFHLDKDKEYFHEVTQFINKLTYNLPHKEIYFYRLSKNLKSKNNYQYVPIEIKIIDPVEQ